MNILKGIVNKSRRKVIGILSGTSIDAVDVVLTEIYGSGIKSEIRILEFDSFPIDKKVRNLILRCSSEKTGNTADICKLNFIIGRLFGIKINEFLKKNKISPNEIDLTGSHGQTIFHYPVKNNQYGYDSKSTMQIGDLSVIANITGVTTIGDFRTADVSVNGDGAPLVPYLDYILSRKINCSSVFLNIGGISNITYIKKNCKLNEVIAFDTGPGNLLIDLISKKYFNKKFDKDGKIAGKGNINSNLLEKIVTKDKFVKKPSPKSTGREYYNEEFIESIVKKNSYDPYDLMATFNFFTAYAVNYNIKKFKTDKIFVSGGGSNNLTLMKNLRNLFEGTDLEILNLNGINSSNKEAVLFAVLANELISGNKTNIISVTGADKNVFLGKICIA
ncbi:MAG TPA: anhydro-N-acetylmuramic acid kinase [Ignavibacteria bacterium]|nr:anhydro-N-acetylmuramic acid kinase [Ignavibacteria bacterium]